MILAFDSFKNAAEKAELTLEELVARCVEDQKRGRMSFSLATNSEGELISNLMVIETGGTKVYLFINPILFRNMFMEIAKR